MTKAKFADIIATFTTTIKSLSDQMAVLTAKVDNNNNNRNNPNRGGGAIPVSRVRNNNPTIVMYRKSKHICESDL